MTRLKARGIAEQVMPLPAAGSGQGPHRHMGLTPEHRRLVEHIFAPWIRLEIILETASKLMVSKDKMTFWQLQEGIRRQREPKRRIGEALVEAGDAIEEQITQGLRRVLLGASLAALLFLPGAAASASFSLAPAKAGSTASSHSTQIRVSATVAPSVRIYVLQQQPSLTITAEDIQHGYVDVPAGTRFRTRTNHRNGFLLNFDGQSNVFERVSVTGIGGTVEIDSAGGSVRAAYTGPESSAQVSYRFYLAQGVQSGNYPWPLQISASVTLGNRKSLSCGQRGRLARLDTIASATKAHR